MNSYDEVKEVSNELKETFTNIPFLSYKEIRHEIVSLEYMGEGSEYDI